MKLSNLTDNPAGLTHILILTMYSGDRGLQSQLVLTQASFSMLYFLDMLCYLLSVLPFSTCFTPISQPDHEGIIPDVAWGYLCYTCV